MRAYLYSKSKYQLVKTLSLSKKIKLTKIINAGLKYFYCRQIKIYCQLDVVTKKVLLQSQESILITNLSQVLFQEDSQAIACLSDNHLKHDRNICTMELNKKINNTISICDTISCTVINCGNNLS